MFLHEGEQIYGALPGYVDLRLETRYEVNTGCAEYAEKLEGATQREIEAMYTVSGMSNIEQYTFNDCRDVLVAPTQPTLADLGEATFSNTETPGCN